MADIINTARELQIAEWAHVDAVAAAKEAAQANPGDKEIQAEFRRVKAEHREFRQFWRSIREIKLAEADATAVGDAIAAPATVSITTGVDQ
jgi:hypothetical protein